MGLAGAVTAIAGIGLAAFEAADKFEKAERQIAFSTGKTGTELDKLGESLNKIYSKSAAPLDVIAGALSRLSIETGATGEQLEGLTTLYLKFSKVTGTEVVQAIKSTQDVFDIFRTSPEDQKDALNTFLCRHYTERH